MPTRDDSLITDELMRALGLQESAGGLKRFGDRNLENPAYGTYQIRKPAYQDVVQRRPEYSNVPFEQVQADQELNETFARAYLSVLANEYGLNTLDDLLMGYNAGPTAVRQHRLTPAALAYPQKVKRFMRKGK